MSQIINAFTDGAARGNPGQAAIAYVIKGLGENDEKFAQTIGVASNNQAEYRALVSVLEKLTEHNLAHAKITLHADSELMVEQVNGRYKVKNAQLKPLFERASELLNKLRRNNHGVVLIHIPRSKNSEADKLGNLALDNKL